MQLLTLHISYSWRSCVNKRLLRISYSSCIIIITTRRKEVIYLTLIKPAEQNICDSSTPTLKCNHCGSLVEAEIHGKTEVVDIQDLISRYKEEFPSCTPSELRSYLVEHLESEYNLGIIFSYPMAEAAIRNELFRYSLVKPT